MKNTLIAVALLAFGLALVGCSKEAAYDEDPAPTNSTQYESADQGTEASGNAPAAAGNSESAVEDTE